jgi:hypothetical protein
MNPNRVDLSCFQQWRYRGFLGLPDLGEIYEVGVWDSITGWSSWSRPQASEAFLYHNLPPALMRPFYMHVSIWLMWMKLGSGDDH